MPVRILVADDHEVVRAGVRAFCASTEFTIVGETSDGISTLDAVRLLRPDILLLDVRMPHLGGLDCLAQLKAEKLSVPTVVFSGHDNPTYMARANALGAMGYLLKDISRDEFLTALRTVNQGGSLWTRDTSRRIFGALATPRVEADIDVPLTKRENEVLSHLAHGLSNKEIAQSLNISYETVKEHVQHILKKVGVSDRTQAAVWAVRNELV